MAITIHQRVHLHIWHWNTGPGWCRDLRGSDELVAFRAAGARVIRAHLVDDGPLDMAVVRMWRELGYKVWGMVWGADQWKDKPEAFAEWCASEKRRLVLEGMDFNLEDNVKDWDVMTNGQWSERFASKWRDLCPLLPCCLDTYWGPAGAGMNLGAYHARGFRMNVQTFWGPEGLYDDPVTTIVLKAAGAQPVIPKANVKPIVRVTSNNSGERAPFARIFDDAKIAGTKGVGLYYVDGADPKLTEQLVKVAIAGGVAY